MDHYERMEDKDLRVRVETETFDNYTKYTLLTSLDGVQWSGGQMLSKKHLVQLRDKLNELIDNLGE